MMFPGKHVLGAFAGALFLWTAAGRGAEKWIPPKIPSFPGAEGHGSVTPGGRGGRVIKVTNLNSSGPGSLQWACSQKGPRIVVFTVSGVITPPCKSKGKNWLSIKDDNITIAGQTAPGAGITIDGMLSTTRGRHNRRKKEDACDIIVRFIRVRPTCTAGGRGSNLRGLELFRAKRMMLDHVSVSWSADDCVALGTSPGATDLSFQWMAIEESDIHLESGDEPHNFAMHTTVYKDPKHPGRPGPMTMHHTLFAHHFDRVPLVNGKFFDYRNNVIYNAGTGGHFEPWSRKPDEHFLNSVGNYAKPGPGSIIGVRLWKPPYTLCWSGVIGLGSKGNFHYAGNYLGERGGYTEGWRWSRPRALKGVSAQPFPAAPVRTHTAEEAYELVRASAGCLPRDVVSRRTIAEVETFTGSWGRHGSPGGLMEGLTPGKAPPDGDNDGMPDAWEKAHGLDPADPKDNNKIVPAGASPGDRHKGYTWIEYYINERADELVAQALTEYRLNTEPPKPWKEAANELPSGAMAHKSLESMVKAIREQVKAKGHRTNSAWYAIQQLSRMGEKARPAVGQLADILLKSEDPRTRCFAAWALGAIGPHAAEAAPALLRALRAEQSVRMGKWNFRPYGYITWALGRIGPAAKDAVPLLGKFVQSKGDPFSHAPAAWALSQMGPAAKAAMPELLKALDSSDRTIRHHAAVALANVGSPAVPGLTKVAGWRPGPAAAAAARALRLIGPEAKPALPALLRLLKSSHAVSRIEAARALSAIEPGGAEVTAALGAALSDKEYGVQVSAAAALGECGAKAASAIPSLEKALGGKKKEVKRAAALALGKIGKPAIPALKKALAGGDPFVRKYAARALGNVGKDASAAVDVLVKALSDANAEVRREAVWSLALIGPGAGSAAGALKKAQSGGADYVVRYAAGVALKELRK